MIEILAVVLALSNSWTTGGPTGGRITAVAVAPSDPVVVWAGDAAGVFRSADGGATWTNVSGPLVDVDFIAVHPFDPNKAWVAVSSFLSARVYRTTDGGATWIDSTNGLPAVRPSALYVDPRNPDTLYLGSRCGVIGFASINAFLPEPQFHETAGVFKSTNGGASWGPSFAGLGTFGQCIEELSIDPFSPWRLFVTGPFSDVAGQSESYDNARSWERTDTPRPGRAVVFDARFPFTHYGISSRLGSRFLVSQDGGFTWNAVTTNVFTPNIAPTALSMDPERSRIFLGTTQGLYRSGNGGTVWAKTSLQDVNVTALAFGRTLFAGTDEGLVEVTSRGLGAARAVDLHDPTSNVTGLAIDPSDPNVVYAGARTPDGPGPRRGRVYRSGDAGASWERLAGDDDVAKADVITVDAAGTVYALPQTAFASLYRRGRDETSWTVLTIKTAYDVAADPKSAGTVFLATSGSLQRSRDGGATWHDVVKLTLAGHAVIDPGDPRRVYAATPDELLRSDDGGDSWTKLQSYPSDTGTYALAVAPSRGDVLYRVTYERGLPYLERSDDRAATWRRLVLPAGDQYPQTMAVDPRDANSLWVGARLTLYHSTDGGATWQTIVPPFVTANGVTALAVDPRGRLHVVYPQHGVWELSAD